MNRTIFPYPPYPLSGDIESQAGSNRVTVTGLENIPLDPITVGNPVDQAVIQYDLSLGYYIASPFVGGGGVTFSGDLSGTDAGPQEVVGIIDIPIDIPLSPLVDGEILQYNSTSGKWEIVTDRPLFPVSAVVGKPGAGQIVMIYTAATSMIFPPNFSSPNSYGSLGTLPTSSAVYTLYKNGSSVGTVTIGTGGVFTFSTSSLAITLNAGDRFILVAPGSQDATLADVGITFVGTRTAVVPPGVYPPIYTWKGAYSGSTTYQPYDLVSYNGSSYICILTTVGNLPTNATYWSLVAQAGSNGAPGGVQIGGDIGGTDSVPLVVGFDGVPLQITSLSNNQILQYNSGAGKWENVTAGGGDLTAEYIIGTSDVLLTNAAVNPGLYGSANNVPASPGSLDDEFAGSTLNTSTRWTWVNQNTTTGTVGNSFLTLTGPNAGGYNIPYIYQTAPSTPWTVRSIVALTAASAGLTGGLVLADASGKLIIYSIYCNGASGQLFINYMSSVTSFSSQPFTTAFPAANSYLQVQDDGTNLKFSVSTRGQSFIQVASLSRTAFLTSGPTRVGLFSNGLASAGIAEIDWFRRTQ